MIEFVDIAFEYRTAGGSVPALRGVSTTLSPGELVTVLGPNGSGKSTLARLANGLLHPSGGRVIVDGIDSRDEASEWDLRSRVGLVFQNPTTRSWRPPSRRTSRSDRRTSGCRDSRCASGSTGLRAVGLTGLERREPHTLSGGQRSGSP
jgi:energy-coupling factor transport system ATP-binding protein